MPPTSAPARVRRIAVASSSAALAWLVLSASVPQTPAAQTPTQPPAEAPASQQDASIPTTQDTSSTTTPIVVAPAKPAPPVLTNEELEARRMRLATLFEGALSDTENWQDHVETPGYRKLLEMVAGIKPDDFSKLVTRDLDYKLALDDPDAQRGEYVRWRGLVGHIKTIKLDTPALGMPEVFRGVVMLDAGRDGSEGVIFDMVEMPPKIRLHEDVVDIEGVLYRGVAYPNVQDKIMRAPYLIARNIRVVDTSKAPRTGSTDSWVSILITLTVTYFLGRVTWYLLVQRKRQTPKRRSEPPKLRDLATARARPRDSAPRP